MARARSFGRVLLALLLFGVVFLGVLAAYLPARWLVGFLPANVSCGRPSGTLWSGRCDAFRAGTLAFDALAWQVHARQLLRVRLGADVQATRADGHARGAVELAPGGRMQLTGWSVRLPIDPAVIPGFPRNWRGQLEADVQRADIEGSTIRALAGTVRARDIVATGSRPAPFGSYELSFPAAGAGPDGTITGALADLGGPVQINGTALLRPDRSWELDGRLAARPGADTSLVRQLEFLGTPDSSGLRSFSVAGTY